jgi:2-oxoglutarate ferredoxin oxidoreductase subunit alpha
MGKTHWKTAALDSYELIQMDVTKMTREALKEFTMGMKEKDRAKNMFVLGFLYWMYGRDMDNTDKLSERKVWKEGRDPSEQSQGIAGRLQFW